MKGAFELWTCGCGDVVLTNRRFWLFLIGRIELLANVLRWHAQVNIISRVVRDRTESAKGWVAL